MKTLIVLLALVAVCSCVSIAKTDEQRQMRMYRAQLMMQASGNLLNYSAQVSRPPVVCVPYYGR